MASPTRPRGRTIDVEAVERRTRAEFLQRELPGENFKLGATVRIVPYAGGKTFRVAVYLDGVKQREDRCTPAQVAAALVDAAGAIVARMGAKVASTVVDSLLDGVRERFRSAL